MSDLRDMPNIVDETAKMRRELDELQLQVLSSSGGGGGGGGNATWGTITGTLSNQTDLQTALDGKVDKVSGKGLSTNDFTTTEKNKLAGIASGAEVNVQSNWTQTDTTADDYIKNKPTLATVATSGSYADLSNKPTIPTVGNGTITVNQGGVQKGQFTTNQSGDTTINIAQSDPYIVRGGTYDDFVNARTSIDLSALHTALKIGRGARLMLADMYKYSYYDAISYTATGTDTQNNEDVVKFRYSDTQMLVMTISGIKEPTQTYSVAVETVSIPLANGTGNGTTYAMTQKATTEMVYPNIGKAGIGIGVYPTVAGYGTAIGTYAKANEFNVALGAYATANTDSVNYSMALGYDSKVTRTGEVNIGSTGATMAGYHGYNNTNYRVLGGVHDAVDDHDAVNKSQLDAVSTEVDGKLDTTLATAKQYADGLVSMAPAYNSTTGHVGRRFEFHVSAVNYSGVRPLYIKLVTLPNSTNQTSGFCEIEGYCGGYLAETAEKFSFTLGNRGASDSSYHPYVMGSRTCGTLYSSSTMASVVWYGRSTGEVDVFLKFTNNYALASLSIYPHGGNTTSTAGIFAIEMNATPTGTLLGSTDDLPEYVESDFIINGGVTADFIAGSATIDLSALHNALVAGRRVWLETSVVSGAPAYKWDLAYYTVGDESDTMYFSYLLGTQQIRMTNYHTPSGGSASYDASINELFAGSTGESAYIGMTQKAITDALATKADIAGAGAQAMQLTQAQYDALSTAEKNNGTIYFITD